MPNQRRYYQPKFTSEIRLGLVVYGGISLAIYMHGICQEFYHAVRGRGIYKLVKALTDADLVVDVISGGSAGGLNGVLLSYALTNSDDREFVDFSSFAGLWRNSGEILRTLYQPNLFKNRQERAGESGFSSEDFYQRELLSALIKSIEHKLPRSSQEWFSTTQELDLFIVGTDYLGKINRTFDATGRQVITKDHHALFHLKHRPGRKEPFNPHFQDLELSRTAADTQQALAKLCRIAAGFPAVFPLVEIDLQNRQNSVDRQLVLWGKLDRHYLSDRSPERDCKLYFLDGGLLDNAPFTCMMKETYYRLPNRIGQRKLFYVDPNITQIVDLPKPRKPDRFKLKSRLKLRTEQVLQAAVFSIPSNQSIANDLRAIQEHNHKVDRYQASIDRAEAAVSSQQLLESEDRTQSQIYLRGRLFDFRDRNLPLLLGAELNIQNHHSSAIFDKIAQVISSRPKTSQEQKYYYKLLDRFEPQTIDLDVEYSIRKHFYLLDRVNNLLVESLDVDANQQLQHLARQLSCNIKLLEVVRASIDLLLKDRAVSNYFYYLVNQESNDRRLHALVYELIFRLHRFLLDGTRLHTFIPENSTTTKLETIPVYFWLDLPELAAQNVSERWLSQTRISSVFAQLKQRITDLQQSTITVAIKAFRVF
jgi:patatin-related protein